MKRPQRPPYARSASANAVAPNLPRTRPPSSLYQSPPAQEQRRRASSKGTARQRLTPTAIPALPTPLEPSFSPAATRSGYSKRRALEQQDQCLSFDVCCLQSYKMPEFRDSKRVPLAAGKDGGGGFFIRRVASPSSLAVRGTTRKHPARRFILPSNDKENMPPVWAVRATPPKRRSPLPKWYPRTPLRDITAIAKAIQRSRLRIAAAQEQSQRSEQSPQSANLTTSAQAERGFPLGTEAASLAVASSSSSIEIENVTSPATTLAEDLKVFSSPAESSSVADTFEKKLSSSIEQIEKMVKKNMKRTPKAAQRSKRIIQKRTLMSLR